MKLAKAKGRPPSLGPKTVALVKELHEDGLCPWRIAQYLAKKGVKTSSKTVTRTLKKIGAALPKVYTYSKEGPREYKSRAASLRWGQYAGGDTEGRAEQKPTYG